MEYIRNVRDSLLTNKDDTEDIIIDADLIDDSDDDLEEDTKKEDAKDVVD
jgi:hypothetical protein